MTDLWLSLAHHLLVFVIAGVIAAEAAMLRPGMTAQQLRLIGGLDALYGISAVLILIVGFGRVYYGLRGPEFFLGNHWFWAKLLAFLVVGILSAPPTIRFIAWRRRAAREPGFVLTEVDVAPVRLLLLIEAAVFLTIPLFAAAMMRVPMM